MHGGDNVLSPLFGHRRWWEDGVSCLAWHFFAHMLAERAISSNVLMFGTGRRYRPGIQAMQFHTVGAEVAKQDSLLGTHT